MRALRRDRLEPIASRRRPPSSPSSTLGHESASRDPIDGRDRRRGDRPSRRPVRPSRAAAPRRPSGVAGRAATRASGVIGRGRPDRRRPLPADRSGSPGRAAGPAGVRRHARWRPEAPRAGRPAARPRRRPRPPRSAGAGSLASATGGVEGLLRLDLLAVAIPREHLGQGDQAHGDRAGGRRGGGRGIQRHLDRRGRRVGPACAAGPAERAHPEPGQPESRLGLREARDGRFRRGGGAGSADRGAPAARRRGPWCPLRLAPVDRPGGAALDRARDDRPAELAPDCPRRIAPARAAKSASERDLDRGRRAVHQRRGIVLLRRD